MSEPTLISPLLDGFSMGNPISEHDGIRCCPAIKENTDKKYIVKILASPASQNHLDAMLLAGAFRDASDAMEYFRDQAEGVLKEAELLRQLSKLEGFLSYESWQMEPITRYRLGYEVYLLGSYKRSLEKYMKHNAVTHLEAINLGLDMCAALSVARQAGYLYVDLKPGNIFLSEKKEYRIGDLGFLDMKELRFTTLPEKYHSSYTPPELYDPMNSVGLTTDTYALGMLLYQLYNDGHLPFKGKAPEEALPSPVQADYELAEIICKAIHPDPQQRYSDPKEMGKALASYLQRNTVNDVAITPLRTKKQKIKKKKSVPEQPTAAPEQESVITEAADPVQEEAVPAVSDAPEAIPPEEAMVQTEPLPQEDPDLPQQTGEMPDSEPPAEPEEEIPEQEPETEDEDSTIVQPVEEAAIYSADILRVMERAEDLIAHDLPQDILLPEEEEPEDPFAFAFDEDEVDESDVPFDPLMEDEAEEDPKKKKKSGKKFKKKKDGKRLLSFLSTLTILAALAAGVYWYYCNLYLQSIRSIIIDGDQKQITVTVDSDIPDEKLTLVCTSSLGDTDTASLSDGRATFTGLSPNTLYTVQAEIDGFHQLTGQTSQIYTTEATTMIVSFTSVAGSEDGSVILNFTSDGDEPPFWTVHYSAEGEEPRTETFTGSSININGLTLGKQYTFTLDAGENRSLGGQSSLQLMASRLILAEDLRVVSSSGSDITVRWDTPGDIVVDSWKVRCYSPMGYDEELTVTENEVQFTGIDPALEYTIEVTAAGMTQPARTGITANPVSITAFSADVSEADQLNLNWECEGVTPEGGWLLMYSIDGGENHVVKCNKNNAVIAPKVPGCKYTFSIQAADGTSVFNSSHLLTVEAAQPYEGNALKQDMLKADLVKTPSDKNWYAESLSQDSFTNQFTSGDPISIVLRANDSFYLPGYQTHVLFVIRDSYGNVLSPCVSEDTVSWKNIWLGGDSKNGELDVPNVPTDPGEYQVDLYFDGMTAAQLKFTIS